MNRSFVVRLVPTALAIALSQGALAQQAAPASVPASTSAATPLASGIDRSTADPSVRIQDDAFRSVEGKWLAETQIPADKSRVGNFEMLYEKTQPQLRELIENVSQGTSTDPAVVADAKKIGDLYASFMDEARIESLGIKPIQPALAKVGAIKSRADIATTIATFIRLGVNVPLASEVHQDAKDSTKYVVDYGQSGIGLPDRDYFLSKTDQRFADVRVKYEAYLAQLLTMSGESAAAAKADAKAVIGLEKTIAEVQWTRVENRDPVKTYNVVPIADLGKLAPHIDWSALLGTADVTGKTGSVVISQPSYVKGLDKLIATVPIPTWKAYFKTHLISAYAPYLDHAFVDARFAFVGTVLRGTPENTPRWKRGVILVESSIGEGLGRLYVAKYFPPESKARMDQLVRNLLAAYKVSIDGLEWMSPDTRKEAQIKLATFTPKIGYPVRWRDYSALVVDRDDLVGNVMRARTVAYRREIDKLGKPIDRDEWGMTPQTINAYYNAEMNEIVFPAAFLQAPFFDPKADDAANYGAIGAVIGHEISHGFDDEGSQYDEKGNLRNWWTEDDRKRFAEKTKALIAQYDAYEVAGYHVNGALTLGENIADNSGLAIAFKAYHLSLNGKEAPVIDGLTGDQRFYLGFVQAWQDKTRDASIIAQIKSDPHSPAEFRANGTLSNQPGFYEAFGVKPGDRMYTAPDKRVIIW